MRDAARERGALGRPSARRWRTLASAAAAIAGGSDVVKMKPLAWLRTLSTTLGRPGDEAAERPVALGQAALHDRDGSGGAERLRHAGALVSVGARRRASRRGR